MKTTTRKSREAKRLIKKIMVKGKKPKEKADKLVPLKDEDVERLQTSEVFGKLNAIQRDVNELLPQLVEEINAAPIAGGTFAGIKSERKLWPRFLHCYASSLGNLSKSCDFCGISRNHYYRARKRYPTLDLLLAIIDERYMDAVEEATKRHALLPRSIVERIFLLKNLRKGKYAEDDKDGKPISVQVNFPHLTAMRDKPKELVIKQGGSNGDDGIARDTSTRQEYQEGSDRLPTSSPTGEVSQEQE